MTTIYQPLESQDYQQLESFYENLVESEPDNILHYCNLGLVYLLNGKEEEAQAVWFTLISGSEDQDIVISELIDILELEARKQLEKQNIKESWLIRQYIAEFDPDNINNLLSLMILAIKLRVFDIEDIDKFNLQQLLKSIENQLELQNNHIEHLKVLLERQDFLKHLAKESIVAEIGVADGTFSSQILELCSPKKLHLIDIWGSERYSQEMKNSVLEKFNQEIKTNQIEINEGMSYEVLKTFPDHYFDWVYIDTDHTYETTAKELDIAVKKVKSDGVIAGHDYTVGNFKSGFPYGVIRAVHEFCAWYGWEMILLTHESHRHLSFALKKQDSTNDEIKTPWRSLVNRNLLFETLQYLLFYFGNQGKIIDFARSCHFFTNAKSYCPVCGSFLTEFQPFGSVVVRQNARCGNCGSLERHRMIWSYLKYETDLFSVTPKKMLHIAPEGCLARNISKYSQIDYLTADLNYSAMVKMDITNIQYPDNSFDVIYCSHVLEHIPDDRKAMRELARVLKPTGWAILQVPIKATLDNTLEDFTVTDPKEKERLFGHEDHVRQYGLDYKNRLEDAGFEVQVIPYLETFTEEQRAFYGLSKKDDIYFCQLQ